MTSTMSEMTNVLFKNNPWGKIYGLFLNIKNSSFKHN